MDKGKELKIVVVSTVTDSPNPGWLGTCHCCTLKYSSRIGSLSKMYLDFCKHSLCLTCLISIYLHGGECPFCDRKMDVACHYLGDESSRYKLNYIINRDLEVLDSTQEVTSYCNQLNIRFTGSLKPSCESVIRFMSEAMNAIDTNEQLITAVAHYCIQQKYPYWNKASRLEDDNLLIELYQ